MPDNTGPDDEEGPDEEGPELSSDEVVTGTILGVIRRVGNAEVGVRGDRHRDGL